MSLFGQTKRHAPAKVRRSPLPVFAAESEKFSLSSPTTTAFSTSKWITTVVIPLPSLSFLSRDAQPNGLNSQKTFHPTTRHGRYVRIPLPIPPRVFARVARLPPIVRIALGVVSLVALVFVLLGFRHSTAGRNSWTPPFVEPNTLVITPEEAAKIWEWEVLSGHHPSLDIPADLPIGPALINPIVAPDTNHHFVNKTDKSRAGKRELVGKGPTHTYEERWDTIPNDPGFAPRPVPGSVIDLDIILSKCDFGTNKYVRDCLKLLRIGGHLDNGKSVRRGNYLQQFRQMYMEDSSPIEDNTAFWTPLPIPDVPRLPGLSRSPLTLPPPNLVSPAYKDAADVCDPLHPRLFHMFWAGPFTDKPYMAIMSFLFTQNLGLDIPLEESSEEVRGTCRPQFWVWINPGPAAAVPNPSAKADMYESLATNPWASPFLHERFRNVVKFKMWNTTEQLDGIDELRPYWRDMQIFNSGGFVYKQAKAEEPKEEVALSKDDAPKPKKKDQLFEKVGSASESDYDRLSVILSDMARFVLTHRYGGIYLDADTLFLRDWEELWNYRGQFAYRWSWHTKYNTAVLKLHKGSALSSFLFKTALENKLDFHPMTVTRYLKDAGLDALLFRIPDALFDAAWLNMERYQRDRPPFPYFPEFDYFFTHDKKADTAGAEPLGFDGFFRGSYSYHFHNFWWLPFDPSRNWPDLGTRFAKGENALREAARAASIAAKTERARTAAPGEDSEVEKEVEQDEDLPDLAWSTVLKRTFEAYVRGERPNMYGEWIRW